MRILLLTHSFNSLTQRLHIELTRASHELAVELDINDATSLKAAELFQPDLIIAPFLKRLIPERIWSHYLCFIVHPGIPGDGGPSSLDWAILNNEQDWGVTVLEADDELDSGPVWSWCAFPMRSACKSSLYRYEVTEAAVSAVFEALDRYLRDEKPIPKDQLTTARLTATGLGRWRNQVRQAERRIDWQQDDTKTVLRKIQSADGNPGILDELAGLPCRLYNAHPEGLLKGLPGALLARRGDAVCRATTDGAVWIGHIKARGDNTFKLPATVVLNDRIRHLPEILLPFYIEPNGTTWQEIRYRESGHVGTLYFDFYNGAMSTHQCNRLRAAFDYARKRPTRIIVLQGGQDFWSNGLDLNGIESAASPADESWRNINAMDDLCEDIINTTSHLTLAALRGNAGAGGCFLALAADMVIARPGILLNPHYRNMGNLYGSEYWTYLLPMRVDVKHLDRLLDNRLPIGTSEALDYGLIDRVGSSDPGRFDIEVAKKAADLSREDNFKSMIADKQRLRREDEADKPLSIYRKEELDQMRLNFYGFDPSYHVARYRFVHHTPRAWTPLYLAPHRRLDWPGPGGSEARVVP